MTNSGVRVISNTDLFKRKRGQVLSRENNETTFSQIQTEVILSYPVKYGSNIVLQCCIVSQIPDYLAKSDVIKIQSNVAVHHAACEFVSVLKIEQRSKDGTLWNTRCNMEGTRLNSPKHNRLGVVK